MTIPTPASPADAYHTFHHEGRDREYLLHIPVDLPQQAPLLLMLHGYTDDASSFRAMTQMDATADRHGFAVVYPRGTLDASGKRFWQVGYDFHTNESVDDEAFLVALVQHLQVTYGLDVARTYVAGMSNGGDMSFVLACRQSTLFRGVAPVVGTMMLSLVESCPAAAPVAILAVNGDADEVTLYAGDMANQGGWGAYISVADVRSFWQKAHGCGAPTMTQVSGSVVQYTFDACQGTSMRFYTVAGGGHVWPRRSSSTEFDASELIGRFVVGADA
jgi:polyhydroxybutyrate depolymerase